MKKEYIFTIKISVDVNDKVKGKGDPKLLGYLQQLLTAFKKHNTAISEHIKFYFPDLVVNGNCYEEWLDILKAKDMPEIVSDEKIQKELTSDAAEFINAIHSEGSTHIKDDISETYRDLFAEQFFMPKILHAEMKEIEK